MQAVLLAVCLHIHMSCPIGPVFALPSPGIPLAGQTAHGAPEARGRHVVLVFQEDGSCRLHNACYGDLARTSADTQITGCAEPASLVLEIYQTELGLAHDFVGDETPDSVPGTANTAKPALETEVEFIAPGLLDHLLRLFERRYYIQDHSPFGFRQDRQDKQDLHEGKIPGTNIIIMKTPGHTMDHASLVVPVKGKTYVVAGDVFWWAENEEQLTDRKSLLNKKDPLAVDEKALRKSREDILEIADFIIPGHGKMFEV